MPSTPRSFALRLIKNRLRSCAEIDQSLAKRGVEKPDRELVIEELTTAGLLDDKRLARAWVNDRDKFNPRGEIVLRMELKKKGIADSIIREVLSDRKEREEEPVDEFEQAKRLVEARTHLYRNLPAETRKRRLGNYLLRRGFSLGTLRRILDA